MYNIIRVHPADTPQAASTEHRAVLLLRIFAINRQTPMRSLLLALMVAAAAADARKSAPRRQQAVQASPSGLSGGGPVARGGSPLPPMAMILPADNVPLMVVEEGAVNFLSLYGGVLTLRILLSWFPQAQSVALLQPIFTVSDI